MPLRSRSLCPPLARRRRLAQHTLPLLPPQPESPAPACCWLHGSLTMAQPSVHLLVETQPASPLDRQSVPFRGHKALLLAWLTAPPAHWPRACDAMRRRRLRPYAATCCWCRRRCLSFAGCSVSAGWLAGGLAALHVCVGDDDNDDDKPSPRLASAQPSRPSSAAVMRL